MSKIEEDRVRRIEDLVGRLEQTPDSACRDIGHSLMEAILEFHGAGLDRILEILFDSGEAGKAAIRRLAGDDLVASLLILHDLHPDDIETRVRQALGKMHGVAEFIGVFEGIVRVRVTSSGCGLKEATEVRLREAVPDAVDIVVEEAAPQTAFVALESLGFATSGRP